MPPALMMFPARIKKGTAIRTGVSIPVNMRWATRRRGVSPPIIRAANGVNPSTKAMGTPMIRKNRKDISNRRTTMIAADYL
jgi:hypothetical protein